MTTSRSRINEVAFKTWLSTHGYLPETVRTYPSNLRYFLDWCDHNDVDPDRATKHDCGRFLLELAGKVSASTAVNRLYSVRAYFHYLQDYGVREEDPTFGLKLRRPKQLPKKALSLAELRRLILKTHTPRDEAMWLTMAATGIRIGELTSMKVENLRWFHGEIVIDGKGNKQRIVAPGRHVMRLLAAIVGDRKSGPVWINQYGNPLTRDAARKDFWKLAKRAGINAHPHQLRVTFANDFMTAGGDLGALQAALGHSDISTTAHYAGHSSQDRALRAMVGLKTAEKILDLLDDE